MSISHVNKKRQSLEAVGIDPALENSVTLPSACQSTFSLLGWLLDGLGSVVEFYPSPVRFDRWRMSEQISYEEWPGAVRRLLLELENDAVTCVEPP